MYYYYYYYKFIYIEPHSGFQDLSWTVFESLSEFMDL